MTAPCSVPTDLTAYEFSIPCEQCDNPAEVMVKGCSDAEFGSLCGAHLVKLERDFERCKPAVCVDCYRPFLFFDTHFLTEAI